MLETTEINEINNAYYREGHKNIMYLRRRTKRFNRMDHTCHKEDNSFIIYSGGRIIRVSRKDHKLIICLIGKIMRVGGTDRIYDKKDCRLGV